MMQCETVRFFLPLVFFPYNAVYSENSHFSHFYIHAAELQAVGIGLVMWHQVVVVENAHPKHCGVDADAQEENTAEAHHLVETGKTKRQESL